MAVGRCCSLVSRRCSRPARSSRHPDRCAGWRAPKGSRPVTARADEAKPRPTARLRRPPKEESNMRKLVVYNAVSLDGYFTDKNGDMSWAHQADPEWQAFVSDNASGGGELL